MKVRSLKHGLHWLFLAVGLIALVLLIISANTYFSYAKEGYGLRLGFDHAMITTDNIDDYWIRFHFNVTNPGRLDILLQTGTLNIGNAFYPLSPVIPAGFAQDSYPLSELPKRETTSVYLYYRISPNQYNAIEDRGNVDVILDMEIYVPERLCTTNLIFNDNVEVSVGV